MTHICVSKIIIIGSDISLSPDWRQAFIWTSAGILLWTIGNKLQWNFNRNPDIFIQGNAFENVVWKCLFHFGLNELNKTFIYITQYKNKLDNMHHMLRNDLRFLVYNLSVICVATPYKSLKIHCIHITMKRNIAGISNRPVSLYRNVYVTLYMLVSFIR